MAPESSSIGEERFSPSDQYFASTFVRNGKIVEHRDDGDKHIYLVGNDWKPGGSKSGLSILGFEKEGEDYKPGRSLFIDILTGQGVIYGEGQSRASGAATPIGGAFDIFGFWEAFGSITEDNPELGWATFLLTKGKKGKISYTLGVSIGKNSKKMTLSDIEKLLGKNWHQNGAKKRFINKFSKLLKGDTNADFYIDKATKQVLLKSNKSENWVETRRFLK